MKAVISGSRRDRDSANDDQRAEDVNGRFNAVGYQRIRISEEPGCDLHDHEQRIHRETGSRNTDAAENVL
jgi:hypothetical protein